MEIYSQQVHACTVIGLRCVDSDPNKRPAAWDIIQMLNATESENRWSGINGGPLVDEIVRDRFANVKEKMQQPSILSCRVEVQSSQESCSRGGGF